MRKGEILSFNKVQSEREYKANRDEEKGNGIISFCIRTGEFAEIPDGSGMPPPRNAYCSPSETDNGGKKGSQCTDDLWRDRTSYKSSEQDKQ